MRYWELAAALSFATLGGWIIWVSNQFPPSLSQAPGPGFFPGLLGWVMLGLSLVLLVSILRAKQSWRVSGIDLTVGRIFLIAGLIALLVFLWQWLRFELGSLVFLFVFSSYFDRSLWKQNLRFSLIVAILLVVFFRYGLRVPM